MRPVGEGLRAHNAASAQLIPAGTPERSLHLHRHPLRVRSSNPGQAGARRRPRGRERSSLSREVKAAGRTAGSSPGGRGFVRGRGFLALRGSARPTAAAAVPGLTCAPPSSWDSPGGWWEGDRPALGQDAHCHSLISSFLTFTVTSVPGLRLGGRSPCPLERLGGRAIMRFSLGSFFFPCLLPQASPSPTPLQCPPPNIRSTGRIALCQAAAQGPWPALPPVALRRLRCFQFPPLLTTLSCRSASCGRTDGFLKLGKFQEGYLQRAGDRRAEGKPQRERGTRGPAQVGESLPPRAGGRWEERSPASKAKSHQAET